MSVVNSQRACIICGSLFYPSMSKSLFICEDVNCKEQYEGAMDELNDIVGEKYDEEE